MRFTHHTIILCLILTILFFFLIGRRSSETKPITFPKETSSSFMSPSPLSSAVTFVSPTSAVLGMQLEVVSRVIDGDTIELANGRRVRYIGVDTPETKDPRRGVQCFGREAYEKNRQLVEGKTVSLEKDISVTDKYGRLLRYVYLGEVLVNELLVREGYAHASSYPPDVKYQDRFRQAQQLASSENKGLWGSVCDESENKLPTTTISGSSEFECDCNKSCKEISSCDEAQFQLQTCGCKNRDGDGDGVACDGAPLLCQK